MASNQMDSDGHPPDPDDPGITTGGSLEHRAEVRTEVWRDIERIQRRADEAMEVRYEARRRASLERRKYLGLAIFAAAIGIAAMNVLLEVGGSDTSPVERISLSGLMLSAGLFLFSARTFFAAQRAASAEEDMTAELAAIDEVVERYERKRQRLQDRYMDDGRSSP